VSLSRNGGPPRSNRFREGLGHECRQPAVEVAWLCESEVHAVTQSPEIFRADGARMPYAVLEPESGIEPVPVHDDAGEPDPCLKDDPRLLRVHGDGPAGACHGHQAAERRSERARASLEMLAEAMATA
jgi:hypothetical protein